MISKYFIFPYLLILWNPFIYTQRLFAQNIRTRTFVDISVEFGVDSPRY